MDQNIKEAFQVSINEDLLGVVISNSSKKEEFSKIKIRPIVLKEVRYYQVSEYKGKQIFHSNLTKEDLISQLPMWFGGLFRQAEISTKNELVTLLISKKGKATIKYKKVEKQKIDINYQHNKQKRYILTEGTPLPFLVDLGVMSEDGFLIKAKSDKFRQLNRFLEYVEDILPFLDGKKKITIIDFGCGKSYLTFAMYYYLKELKEYNVTIIGLDLKKDVIDHCNSLCLKYGYTDLKFLYGDIASYEGYNEVDMVVSLHACDTATDYALHKAVNWGAKVILSVPCCQHEINKQMDGGPFKTLMKYGIIKERMSALITDAIRANLLEMKGYKVQLLEFIDMEHTPKNILIRAVRKSGEPLTEVKNNDLYNCMELLGVDPTLERLLMDEHS